MEQKKVLVLLVLVLLGSSAALAGTAYAYSGTYADTIGNQDVDAAYLAVSASKGAVYYGKEGLDLDIEYNTVNDHGQYIYYQIARATVNDSASPTMVKVNDAKTAVRFCIPLYTVAVTAKGDAATVETVTATYDASKLTDADHGASAFVYLSATALTAVPTAEGYSDLSPSAELEKDGVLNVYAYIVIDVKQIGGTACPLEGYEGYRMPIAQTEPPVLLGNAGLKGFDISFTATAAQTATA